MDEQQFLEIAEKYAAKFSAIASVRRLYVDDVTDALREVYNLAFDHATEIVIAATMAIPDHCGSIQ